jgi:glycosyltransferase involved in cell wall biosynthesis
MAKRFIINNKDKYNVVCFGARDYYQVALTLDQNNILNKLITDFYCPDSLRRIIHKRFDVRIKSKKTFSVFIFFILNKFFSKNTIIQKYSDFLFGFFSALYTYFGTNRAIVYSYYLTGFMSFYEFFNLKPKKIICFQDHPSNEFINKILRKDKKLFLKHQNINFLDSFESAKEFDYDKNYIRLLKRVDSIFCASRVVKNSINLKLKNSIPIYVVPYGSNFSQNYEFKKKKKNNVNKIKLISVCQLIQRKGMHWAFHAMNTLDKKIQKKFDWIVISNFIDRSIMKIAPNNVKFIKKANKKRLKNLIRNSDLFVMPSLAEGFGHVYNESLSLQTPVLYTSNTGVDHILTNSLNSIKVKSSSLKSLQIVFKKLYYGSINLEKMSKQCNLLSSHFSWNTFRKKIFKLVCNL